MPGGLYKRIVTYLFYRLRKDSGFIPPRDLKKADNSFVHESVDIKSVTLNGNNAISKDCVFMGDVTLGKYTTVGERSFFHGGRITIGNYCQFGPHSAIYSIEHPVDHLTIYNNKRLFNSALKKFSVEGEVTIGHGVWVGHGVCILKGTSVGNGAIIGANAVVTKDIPPYAIAVGNPARVVRYRFSAPVCQVIEKSKWWALDAAQLNRYRHLFLQKVESFTDEDLKILENLSKQDK